MAEKTNSLSALLAAFNAGIEADNTEKVAADEAVAPVEETTPVAEPTESAVLVEKTAEIDILPALKKLAEEALGKDVENIKTAAEDFGKAFAAAALQEFGQAAALKDAFAAGYDAMSKTAQEIAVVDDLTKVASEAYVVMAQDVIAREAYEKMAEHVVEHAAPTAEEIQAAHDSIVKEAYEVMHEACKAKGLGKEA